MSNPSLSEFADKISETMPLFAKEFARMQADELYSGKITLQQFLCLTYIFREDELTMTQLAHYMGITTAATTGIIDRLVKSSYVVRVLEASDRRVVKVRLTSKGSNLVEKINTRRRRMLTEIFGRISEEDRNNYLRIMMKIKDVLLERAKE